MITEEPETARQLISGVNTQRGNNLNTNFKASDTPQQDKNEAEEKGTLGKSKMQKQKLFNESFSVRSSEFSDDDDDFDSGSAGGKRGSKGGGGNGPNKK